METGKTMDVTWAGTFARSTLITSSSPSPSPVRLSPVCSIEPSGDLRLLKKTKYSSERILWFSASPRALASRSKSTPVVDRTSQPRPTATAVRPGAAFVSETLPPLERLTPIVHSLSASTGRIPCPTLVSDSASSVQTGLERLDQRLTGSREVPIQSPAEHT